MRTIHSNISFFNRLGFFLAVFLLSTTRGYPQTAPPPADTYDSALIDFFKVTEQQINEAKVSGIPDEELPVVFFIAQKTRLEPGAVTGVRSSGLSWMQVAFHYHLNPWLFYTFLSSSPSDASFGPIYEKFKKPTFKINLTDADIVNLVNLKFLSECYGRDPKEIVQKRTARKTFRQINDEYWDKRHEHDYDWDVVDPNATPTPVPDLFQKVTGGL